jgi:hypothetical protein
MKTKSSRRNFARREFRQTTRGKRAWIRRPRFESLERRALLAVLYVNDDSASGEIVSPSAMLAEGEGAQVIINKSAVDGAALGDQLTILAGEAFTWRYRVVNSGDAALSNVTVTDSEAGVTPAYVSGDANGDDILGANESWLFEAAATAVAGLQTRAASVTADYTDSGGQPAVATSSDDCRYFGADPEIGLNLVAVDGNAALDDGNILIGETMTWRYRVRNAGNIALSNIVVSTPEVAAPAYVNGDLDGDNRLDRGEIWIYEGSGTAVAGRQAITGSVSGDVTDAGQHLSAVNASDDGAYYGADPQIVLNKVIVDGGFVGDGGNILIGEEIAWRYRVGNIGNVALSNIVVSDEQAGLTPVYVSGDVDGDNRLDRREIWVYQASGTALPGNQENTATAAGSFTDMGQEVSNVSSSDVGVYHGADPQIVVNVVTVDGASVGDQRQILVGESMKWRYRVANVGNVALSNVTVIDSDPAVTPVYVSGDVDGDQRLDVNEIWRFEAAATAVAGLRTATATASGSFTDAGGHTRSDTASDDGCYFGADPQLAVNVKTVDGDFVGAHTILTGEPIKLRVTVVNVGNVALSNVTVRPWGGMAYVSGDVDGDHQLDCNETWRFEPNLTARYHYNTNQATVEARFTDSAGHVRTDQAAHHSTYFGLEPHISVDLRILDGDHYVGTAHAMETLTWRYLVSTNWPNALEDVELHVTGYAGEGRRLVSGDTNGNQILDWGEVWIYESSGPALPEFSDIDTKVGAYGTSLPDSAGHQRSVGGGGPYGGYDWSYYRIANPALVIEKYVKRENDSEWLLATSPPGPSIPVGSTVMWQYVVRQDSNRTSAAYDVVIVDDNGTPADPSDDFSPTYVSGDLGSDGELISTGEEWIYAATAPTVAGLHESVVTVESKYADYSAGHVRDYVTTTRSYYTGTTAIVAPVQYSQSSSELDVAGAAIAELESESQVFAPVADESQMSAVEKVRRLVERARSPYAPLLAAEQHRTLENAIASIASDLERLRMRL